MAEKICPCCLMENYGYGDNCEVHGEVCAECAHECQGCGRKGCYDESGRGCLIEHDWGYFCDQEHIEEYAQHKGLKL